MTGLSLSADGYSSSTNQEEDFSMGLVVLLLLLALLFGGVGLFVAGLKWALIIALALFIASFFTGTTYRRRGSAL